MWHKTSNRKHKPTNNRDHDLDQSRKTCLIVILAVLCVWNGASILYGVTQSPDAMKAWPFALMLYMFMALLYAIAYSGLVRKGIFTSLYFLIAYHALLGTITFLHGYLYYLVAAAVRGGAYFPGWLHLTAVKRVAYSSTIWYAVHLAFFLFALVVSRISDKNR